MATLTSPLQALLQGRGCPRSARDGGKPSRALRECCAMTEPSTEDEEEAGTRLLEEDDFDEGSFGNPEEDGTYGGSSGGASSDGLPSDVDEDEDDEGDEGASSWGSRQQQRARGVGSLARRLQQERRRQKAYRRPRQRCGEAGILYHQQQHQQPHQQPLAGVAGEGAAQGGRPLPVPGQRMTLEQIEQVEAARAAYRAATSAVARRQEQQQQPLPAAVPGVFAASLVTNSFSATPFWALQPCYSYPPSQQAHHHAAGYYQHHQQQAAQLPPGLAYHPLQQQQQLQGGPLVRQPAYVGQQQEEDDDPVTFHELLGWDEAPAQQRQQQQQQQPQQQHHLPQFDSIGGCCVPFPIAAEEAALPPPQQQQMLAASPEELRAAEEAATGAARREEARQRAAAAAVAAMAGQVPQAYHQARAHQQAWQAHQQQQAQQQAGKPPRPHEGAAPTVANPVEAAAPGPEVWEVGPRYRVVRVLGHGSYGEVAEAWDTVARRRVAVKRIRNAFENVTDARRIYREMYILRQLRSHPNMVTLLDVVPPKDFNSFVDLYLVFEYVDTDLYKLILSPQQLTNDHIETFVYQLLLSLKYLQSAHVIHRDLKPANILLNEDCSLKLCDFGLARVVNQQCIRGQQGAGRDYVGDALSPITEGRTVSPPPPPAMGQAGHGHAFGVGNPPPPAPRLVRRQMSEVARREEQQQAVAAATAALGPPPRLTRQLTKHVVTRWYRAPELILLQDYTQAVDVWSLGCIFAELLSMQVESVPNHRERAPLFPGKSCFPLSVDQARPSCADKLDQLNVIFDVIGTPSEEDLEGLGPVKRYFQALAPKPPRPLSEFYPGAHPEALDLLSRMLRFNPDRRITVDEALAHPYLQHVRDPSLEVTLGTPLMDRGTSGLSLERVKRALYEEIRAFHAPGAAAGGVLVPAPAPVPASAQQQSQTQQQQAYAAARYYQQQYQQGAGAPPRAEALWSASQQGQQPEQQQQQGYHAGHRAGQQPRGHAGAVAMMEC